MVIIFHKITGFDQINVALLGIKDFFQKHLNISNISKILMTPNFWRVMCFFFLQYLKNIYIYSYSYSTYTFFIHLFYSMASFCLLPFD